MSSAQKVSEQNLFFRLLEAKAGGAKGDGRAKGTELVAFLRSKKPLTPSPLALPIDSIYTTYSELIHLPGYLL